MGVSSAAAGGCEDGQGNEDQGGAAQADTQANTKNQLLLQGKGKARAHKEVGEDGPCFSRSTARLAPPP